MRYVVIIGAARSGTKLLRSLLAASPEVHAIPYDVNYIWRQGLEDRPDDVLLAADATPARAEAIRSALTRAAGARSDDAIIVEKTVSNTLRVAYVNKVLPDARFIHLVRDGRDVAESAARMWQARPDLRYLLGKMAAFPLRNFSYAWWYLKNLAGGLIGSGRGVRVWGPRYPGIESDALSMPVLALCARQWRESVDRARLDLHALPATRVLTIRYEDLVRDQAVLESVAKFAGLDEIDRIIDSYRRDVSASNIGKWQRSLAADDQRQLNDTLGKLLAELGYT